jgi:hypothetical protein
MKVFRGIRLVYRILKAIGEVELVNQQRLRRILHDMDTLTLQQNTNRNLSSHMDDMANRMIRLESEVVRMREAAEFFGTAAEALAKEVKRDPLTH